MQGRYSWKTVRTHGLIVLPALVLGALVGLGVAEVSQVKYTAHTDVFVVASRGTTVQESNDAFSLTQDQATNFAQLATRQIVLQPVIQQLHLDLTETALSKRIRASVPLDTTIISIAATDTSARRAAEIANAVATSLATAVDNLTPTAQDAGAPVALRTIQNATIPGHPSSPHTRLDVAIGALAGLCLGVALIAARDALRAPEDDPSPATSKRRSGASP